MAGGAEAPTIAPPATVTITDHEVALPDKERRECHTIDRNDETRAVCGFRFRTGPNGSDGPASGIHSRSQCVSAGHRHCQPCLAMEELGLDGGRG